MSNCAMQIANFMCVALFAQNLFNHMNNSMNSPPESIAVVNIWGYATLKYLQRRKLVSVWTRN